ncbi:hypothetical protein O0880_14455 [Janthinobacterium sp. SUN118]|uniref:hypothetical protein n=1 Tax=Janthinobacterium sp. SUN118 TaxID=3004100 RepID=UPI0025AF2D21|nr:hypothetical protein [Janthinobacterium sp. SUN118]MDN2710623.1 hypothetical protein [Janthinobacterium sp. SUN118]
MYRKALLRTSIFYQQSSRTGYTAGIDYFALNMLAMTVHAIIHRGITIITLAASEEIARHCAPGHTAIRQQADGWWLYFVDIDGSVDGYDSPFASHAEALWAAKAAAEFSTE